MTNEPSDEILLALYDSGDDTALEILIHRYAAPIFSFVGRIAGSFTDAEDITQETFVSVWKNLHRLDRSRYFKSWLFTIAKNAALNWRKKKKATVFSELSADEEGDTYVETVEDPAPLPDELAARAEDTLAVTAEMAKLNPMYRTVLQLYYREKRTLRDIATLLNESVNTVKSRHRRALTALKELFTK